MRKFPEQIHLLAIGLVATIALAVHLYASAPLGVGVSHDSVFYINTGENILAGKGVYWTGGGGDIKPMIHFPPLYPLLLTGITFFAGSVIKAATWSAAILFGATVFLIGWIIYIRTRSIRAAVLGEMIFISSPSFFEVYLEAMSEPLYLMLMLVVLLLLSSYLADQKRWKINLSAIVSSMAFLTRYAGASLIATGVIALAVFSSGSRREKISDVIRYAVIAGVANLVWSIRNFSLTGSFSNRVFTFHPPGREKVNEAITTLSSWLGLEAGSIEVRIGAALFVLLLVLGIVLGRVFLSQRNPERKSDQRKSLENVMMLHGLLYLSFLLVSLTFFDASTRLSFRILSPVYAMLLILLFIEGYSILKLQSASRIAKIRLPLAGLILVAGLLLVPQTLNILGELRDQGRGFNSREWRDSQIIDELRKMGTSAAIYSNEALAVLYLSEIPAYSVPEITDPVKGSSRSDFDELLAGMRQALQMPNSALAIFHQGELRPGIPSLEDLTEGLSLFRQSSDGVLFVGE